MRYNPAFDGIRAIAVLSVVAFHCHAMPRGGFIGVDVFFVLSGFLITSLLRAELRGTGKIALGRFFLGRILRLGPPLYLMLTAYVIAAPFFFPDANAALDFALAGLYLSDYSRAFWKVPEYINHTWSLSVEEHFYILWPFVILACRRLKDGAFFCLLAAGFAAASLWRMYCIGDGGLFEFRGGAAWDETYFRFDTRMSGLVLGSALSVFAKPPRAAFANGAGAAALLLLAVPALILRWKEPAALGGWAVLVDVAAAALIIAAAARESLFARLLGCKPLAYLGLLSYSIYLWHYPVARILRDRMEHGAAFLAVTAISVALAALSYEFLEKPLRAYRKSLAATKSAPGAKC